tara:strand:- start:6720 stop:7148 length:429 start_codon:yes stop_codon:yes gene_type:complete
MNKWIFLPLIFLVACSQAPSNGTTATVFKSPQCGCCVGFIGYLESDGYTVARRDTNAMDEIHRQHNIPSNIESCHTTIIGDYFVEGHVPMEAIDKLLTEKPDIDGIALPRMPSGSPGMPGPKRETWTIYALKDGKTSTFMTI